MAICLLAGCQSSAGSASRFNARLPGPFSAIKCSAQAASQAVEVLQPYPGSGKTVRQSTILASYREGIGSVEAVTCMQGLGYVCARNICAGIDMQRVVVKFFGGG